MKRRIFQLIFVVILIGLLIYAGMKISDIMSSKVPESSELTYLYIPSGSSLEDLEQQIEQHEYFGDLATFRLTTKLLGFTNASVRPGKYAIRPGTSYLNLVRQIKSGQQTPVNVVLNNERTLPEVAAKLSRYLEPDSLTFLTSFHTDSILNNLGYNDDNLMSLFIPNTYQFMWNTDVESFLERMKKEHEKFWAKENRKAKADRLGMTPEQIYTLASIVEKESQWKAERPVIAGLYLNRLKIGEKLQADPTVVFALQDFTITRVLYNQLLYDSPFNTYLYEGLPPGPICMASINSIDAVLNAENHEYLFMCAAPDTSGKHVFAETYQEHLKNAALYRKWLDKMGF